MMTPGRDTLREIDEHVRRAHSDLESTSDRLEALNRELNTLRVDTAENFRQLARYRLDDLQAERLVGRLDDLDRTVVALLDKHRDAKAALDRRIAEAAERVDVLGRRRAELQEERDAAGEALEERLETVRARVAQTDPYREQQARTDQAAEVARKADEKASRAEEDRAEKGRPYEEDTLFMYLWNRRYLTPDYRANPIARLIDGWVARLIRFREARANYHMLQEIPAGLRDHATKTAQTAQLEAQALASIERKAAEADGVPELQKRLDDMEDRIHALDEDIEGGEAGHRELIEEREKMDAGDDGHPKQAFELVLAELQREELSELYRRAQSTPRPEDDAVVHRIGQIKDRLERIRADIAAANDVIAERRKALAELETIRRRFRRNSYDAYDSGFPSDFAVSVLLGQVLGGLMGSDRAWQEIGRNQRRRGGGGFGGFGGPSRGGWGGFGGSGGGGIGRPPGGFGGGGFRTGGGF